MCFLCPDLIWKPIKEKVRFVLVSDSEEKFIKQLMGVFFYHFWTSVWPHIGKRNESDLSTMNPGSEKLIAQTTNASEGFVNFGCIATGILQIIAINFHQTIWKKYSGWLRTVTSTIPQRKP